MNEAGELYMVRMSSTLAKRVLGSLEDAKARYVALSNNTDSEVARALYEERRVELGGSIYALRDAIQRGRDEARERGLLVGQETREGRANGRRGGMAPKAREGAKNGTAGK